MTPQNGPELIIFNSAELPAGRSVPVRKQRLGCAARSLITDVLLVLSHLGQVHHRSLCRSRIAPQTHHGHGGLSQKAHGTNNVCLLSAGVQNGSTVSVRIEPHRWSNARWVPGSGATL